MKNKSIKIILLILISTLLLSGCKNKDVEINPIKNKSTISYILTTEKGHIEAFQYNGEPVFNIDIGNNNSDYIYINDEGYIYDKDLKDGDTIPNILYALDKNKSIVKILKITDSKIEEIDEFGVRDGHLIDKIKAYNGNFYYSILSNNMNAKKHSFTRSNEYLESGIVDYEVSQPIQDKKEKKTYIINEDKSDVVYKAFGINKNIEKQQSNIVEIPYILDDWTISNNKIFFFFNNYMGQYDLNKDVINLYFGSKETIKSNYIDGNNKKILTLNKLGDNASKSVLFNLEPNFLQIKNAIEFEEAIPLDMFIEKDDFIYIAFKNMNDDAKTRSRIHVLNYKDFELKGVVPSEYVPTKVLGNNGYVLAFNPYEDYLLFGHITEELREFKTSNDNHNFTDVFITNFKHKSDYIYNENNEVVNNNGEAIDENGYVIKGNKKLNRYGQTVNEFGFAINDKNQKIDKYNNVIDDNGKIIEYVADKDGRYRNEYGNFVNSKGETLIKNEKGEWVEKEIKVNEDKENIPGYYDEKGIFHISPEYLRQNPDVKIDD